MILESVKTSDKSEVMAVLARYCESPELLYVSLQHLDGKYVIEVQRPTKNAIEDTELVGS